MKPDISMADALELVKQGRVYRNTATDVFTQLRLSGNPRSTRKGWAIPVSTPSGQKLVPLTDFAAWSHYISDT